MSGRPAGIRPPNGPTPAQRPPLSAEAQAELATLTRQHQRGQLTDAEFAAARARLM
jgi:hypothetical protein